MKNLIQTFRFFLTCISLIPVFIFSCLLSTTAQNTSWQSNGPFGGSITCLALSKSNPDILYAGTKSGIYKSENGGDNWIKTNFPVYYEATSIEVHTTNSDIILAGTKRQGIYRSQNGGQSWKYMGLMDFIINTMTVDENNPDVLYFGTGDELTGSDIGIYKVVDDWQSGGPIKFWESWGECGWKKVCQIVVDPDSSNWIFAAGINSGYCSNYGGILISQDGGDSWTNKNTGYDNKVSNIAITKNSQGERTIFILDGGTYTSGKNLKLFKSNDMGDSWQEVVSPYSGDLNSDVLMTHPANSNSVIIGSYSKTKPIWIYNNETDTWNYISGSGFNNSCLEVSSDGNTFYMTTYPGGIHKFNAIENKWKKINIGIDNSYVNDLIVTPENCNTVYAATAEEEFLVKTTDAGATWEINQSNIGASFDVLTVDPNNPSVFYAGLNTSISGYYLFKGQNNGLWWTGPIKFVECKGNACYTEITDILVKPGDPNSILVSTQPYFLSSGLTGFGTIARSTDGGTNWDELIHAPGSAMAVDPQNPDIVYIGKERSGQVFKVENAWENQKAIDITPGEEIDWIKEINVQDVAVDYQSNVFVATDNGFWRRSGEIWTKLNCPAENITSLATDDSRNPSLLFAGSATDGIFVSSDSGDTWMTFNEGLGNLSIRKLVVCNEMIYAGTEYGGVWCREISETISPAFLTHNTGNMKISVFQNGSIGHAAPNWTYGDGLIYKNNIDPLFNAGLIFGTSERSFVNGQLGCFGINSDFQNSSPISGFETIPGNWDQVTKSVFNDHSSLSPLGIEVIQRSYSNNGEDILLLKYSLKNESETLNDMYVGLFADWDVGGDDFHSQNLGGFDMSRNLVYQYLENGNPDQNYYGIVALSGISGTRITGQGNHLYIRDSSFVWISTINNTEITEAGEYRMWIGSGPFNLNTDDSQLVYFAIVAGSTLEELKENADLAAQKYQGLLTDISVNQKEQSGFYLNQNYPNPFSNQTEIEYSIPYDCKVQLDLMNIEGMKVKTMVYENQMAGKYKIRLNKNNLNPGFYLYQLRADVLFTKTKKMFIK